MTEVHNYVFCMWMQTDKKKQNKKQQPDFKFLQNVQCQTTKI